MARRRLEDGDGRCKRSSNLDGRARAHALSRSLLEIATAPPLETQEQQALFVWADAHAARYPELRDMYAVPNGAYKSRAMAARFQREGLKAGVPDIVLPHARGGYHALYIEMKRRRAIGKRGAELAGNKESPQQLDWHERLRAAGNYVVTAYGWDLAVREILCYLSAGTVSDHAL